MKITQGFDPPTFTFMPLKEQIVTLRFRICVISQGFIVVDYLFFGKFHATGERCRKLRKKEETLNNSKISDLER